MRSRSALAILVATLAVGSIALASCGSSSGDAGAPDPEPANADDPSTQAEAIFAQVADDGPLCTAAVRDGDELVWAGAFGSDDDGPITTDTEVDIASVSKQFTGLAIELLIDRGELDGSDLVGELVPAAAPAADDLTVDELLTHTSGLIDYGDLLPQEYDEPTTQAQAVAAIAASEPTDRRGEFDYSNSNYVLLAEVVEAVAGEPLPDFLDAEVFGPLGLDMALDPRSAWAQVGDGSVWTTPTELVAWSAEWWDQTLEGPDLRTVMFDPEVDASEGEEGVDDRYGSGVLRATDEEGALVIFHTGSWDGYETDWAVLPDEQLAAAVTCLEDAELTTDEAAADLLALWRG